MHTLTELAQLLDGLGIPWANTMFKPQESPAPPFIVLNVADIQTHGADNENYAQIADYDIEVYTDRRDYKLEKKVQAALDSAHMYYTKAVYIIENENLTEAVYTVSVEEI